MKKRKVNCICRCTPRQGIVAMNVKEAKQLFEQQMSDIAQRKNPRHIADIAIQVGNTLQRTGHPRLALMLMNAALSHLISVDENQLRYYERYEQVPSYYTEFYMPWRWRTSEEDARRLAAVIDEHYNAVNQRLGYDVRSHLRFRIHDTYESLFEDIYETWRQ